MILVTSQGSPLIAVPHGALATWDGADPPTDGRVIEVDWQYDRSGPATDYDRACALRGRAGAITGGDAEALVQSQESLNAVWLARDSSGRGDVFLGQVWMADEERFQASLVTIVDREFPSSTLVWHVDDRACGASTRLCPAPISQRRGRTFAILAQSDESDFLLGLAALTPSPNASSRAHPAPFDMFWCLATLYNSIDLNGMASYLSAPEGDSVAFVLESCSRIGAGETAAYLEAAAALFPEGVIPQNNQSRAAMVDGIWLDTSPVEQLDPLRKLDEQFRGAASEIARCVRAFVIAHREVVLRALGQSETRAALSGNSGSPAKRTRSS